LSPHGKKLAESGAWVNQPYQWSSKEFHQGSRLVYYLYRWYASELGRFANRDPIEENGGISLYSTVGNNPIIYIDLFGLETDFSPQEDWTRSPTVETLFFLKDFIENKGDELRSYGEDHELTKLVKASDGMKNIREQMKAENCPCPSYDTLQGYKDMLKKPLVRLIQEIWRLKLIVGGGRM